jgi:hypothetical protein
MFAEINNNTGIEIARGIACKFLMIPVAMHELKVAQSHQRPDYLVVLPG